MSDIVDEVLRLVESYANDAACSDVADADEAKRLTASMRKTKAKIKSRIDGLCTQLADATRKLEALIQAAKQSVPRRAFKHEGRWVVRDDLDSLFEISEHEQLLEAIDQAIEQGKGGDE
jgi:uncharacterized membrane protein